MAGNLDTRLVLVQNLTLKVSLACAFKAINNIMSTFVSIESANYLIYMFFRRALELISIIAYKKIIPGKANRVLRFGLASLLLILA